MSSRLHAWRPRRGFGVGRPLFWLLSAWLGACAPSTATAPTPAHAATKAAGGNAGGEASVRPGVNDRYYEDGALEKWRGIFEAESREVVRERDAIVAAIHVEPGTRVADLGAGTGLFMLPLSKAVGPDGELIAVDIVPSFLDRLRELAGDAGATNVRVVEGKEQATGLPEASIDLALLINVYHHLEYPVSYMRSVFETLRPEGRLVVVDFHRIEGVTTAPMLKHVRADQATVRAEIESVGFVVTRDEPLLKQNYFMELRRP